MNGYWGEHALLRFVQPGMLTPNNHSSALYFVLQLTNRKKQLIILLNRVVKVLRRCIVVSAELTPRAHAKRERIHRAAQTLFMQHGFEATSMDAIAVAAGVSKPTLYRYYQNKEALFIAVLEQLAMHHLSESILLALRERPMDSLATLEHALTVWGQVTIKS